MVTRKRADRIGPNWQMKSQSIMRYRTAAGILQKKTITKTIANAIYTLPTLPTICRHV